MSDECEVCDGCGLVCENHPTRKLRCWVFGHYYRYERFDRATSGYIHYEVCTCGHERMVDVITDPETVQQLLDAYGEGDITLDLEADA